MNTVYLETTIIGHLAGRPNPEPSIAWRQTVTREWWVAAQVKYRLLISELVVDECLAGDPEAAKERLAFVEGLGLLQSSPEAKQLADELMNAGAVPLSEPRDAYHIAVAAVNGVQYLVTWNFKHIANAAARPRIEDVCRVAGYEPPIICTPEELGNIYASP